MIPFLFQFASLIRLQREPAGPGVRRVPGGKPGAIVCGILGLVTVTAAMVLSFVPTESEVNLSLWIMKLVGSTLVMCLGGVILYAVGRHRQSSHRRRSSSPTS